MKTTPKRRRKASRIAATVILRTLLVLFTIILVAVIGLSIVLSTIFHGPSESARNVLTMSLLEPSATKWIPGLFLGKEKVEQIRAKVDAPVIEEVSNPSQVIITSGIVDSDEWKDHPDGIYIEEVKGATFTAHVMIIRDPSKVYLATSSDHFSMDIPGTRIQQQIETEGAIAAINAGAFNDDGTPGSHVGRLPIGMVVSDGEIVWDDGRNYEGFVGFNEDNVLIVANSMDQKRAKELKIRDGCCFGPVLISNGEVNQVEFSSNSGYNPRTAIGQRADGAVIFVCCDGRQPGALGATYTDVINILYDKGAVNACNLDGGSSTVMLYRDTYGLYGPKGEIQTMNNYSLMQKDARRMPTFFMVRPADKEG